MTQNVNITVGSGGGCCLITIFDLLWQITKGIIMVLVTLLGIAACCGASALPLI